MVVAGPSQSSGPQTRLLSRIAIRCRVASYGERPSGSECSGSPCRPTCAALGAVPQDAPSLNLRGSIRTSRPWRCSRPVPPRGL